MVMTRIQKVRVAPYDQRPYIDDQRAKWKMLQYRETKKGPSKRAAHQKSRNGRIADTHSHHIEEATLVRCKHPALHFFEPFLTFDCNVGNFDGKVVDWIALCNFSKATCKAWIRSTSSSEESQIKPFISKISLRQQSGRSREHDFVQCAFF